MDFKPFELSGAFLISSNRHTDDRGYFVRTFCEKEFSKAGLEAKFVQHNISFSRAAGTLRGLHFQEDPYGEIKVVRVLTGRIFDVLVDVRPKSPTFGKWAGVELAAGGDAVYIPRGFAHGLQTLEDNTEVMYLMSDFYQPSAARTILFNDPDLSIHWPRPVTVISPSDQAAPLMKEIPCLK